MRTFFLTLLAATLAFLPQARADRELIWTPDRNYQVSGTLPYNRVVVMDARETRNGIGWLKTGAFNRYGTLVTEDSLETCLNFFANDLLSQKNTHRPGELLVVLRNFWLEDRKGAEEIGTVHLRADLFRGSGDSYQHLRMFDTLYETKSGWDVTASLRVMASQAIVDMMQIGAEPIIEQATYTRDEALARRRTTLRNWPVYATPSAPKGIYRTFDEFLQVRPSDTDFIILRIASMEGPSVPRFFNKNKKGKKGKPIHTDSCFEISDGTDWYVARRGGFSKMPREGDEFVTIQQLRGLTDNSAVWALAFGMVGAVIASSDQSKHYTRYLTCLDPENRRFVPWRRVR